MIVGDHLVGAVIADGALAVLIKAVPALPHRCGADSDLIQPAGALGVQQHLEGRVGMSAVGQCEQDVRRAGKAGANLVIILFDQMHKVFSSLGADILREDVQVQRQHIGGLELVLYPAAAVRKYAAVGICHLAAQIRVKGGVLILAEDACNRSQPAAGVKKAGRGGVFAARLPLAHLGHIGRDPVAKVQDGRRVPDIAVLADAEPCPEAAGLDIFLHRGIHRAQNVDAAGRLVERPRHIHAGIAPPVHRHLGHRGRESVALHRHSVGNTAARPLLGLDIAQPFFKKTAQLKVVKRCRCKDIDVSGPAHPLIALGAVGRNVNKIGFCAPCNVGLQPVEQLV